MSPLAAADVTIHCMLFPAAEYSSETEVRQIEGVGRGFGIKTSKDEIYFKRCKLTVRLLSAGSNHKSQPRSQPELLSHVLQTINVRVI